MNIADIKASHQPAPLQPQQSPYILNPWTMPQRLHRPRGGNQTWCEQGSYNTCSDTLVHVFQKCYILYVRMNWFIWNVLPCVWVPYDHKALVVLISGHNPASVLADTQAGNGVAVTLRTNIGFKNVSIKQKNQLEQVRRLRLTLVSKTFKKNGYTKKTLSRNDFRIVTSCPRGFSPVYSCT